MAMRVRTPSASFPPHEVSSWRRIRRYAVPRWMIEQATERRLAGDWRGACAAAGVDVTFDLTTIANEHGTDVATSLEDDLRHLAPDLVRWHLPRVGRGRTTITPDQTVVLGATGPATKNRPDAPRLHLVTTRWAVTAPQRLSLRFGRLRQDRIHLETDWTFCSFWRQVVHDWSTARHLWDARHADELRERCGGDATRAPYLNPDGTPSGSEPPARSPGPAEHTEWVTALHDGGDIEAAFAAAGIDLDTSPPDLDHGDVARWVAPRRLFERLPLALTRIAPEIDHLSGRGAGDEFLIPVTQHMAVLFERHGARLRGRAVAFDGEPPYPTLLPETCWRRPPDLDLLRGGHIRPEHLHPLVREALCPGRPGPDGPAGPPDPARPGPVRVRCRGEWHEVCSRDGVLAIPHDDEELRREQALQAFGGATAGCFAVRRAWLTGTGRLPKALRDQREEIFARARHGDAPGVIRLLDAGVDPHIRNARRRTLLHELRVVDHTVLLPRLLAAGVDLESTDEDGRTPLFLAACGNGSAELVHALLAAGARIDTTGGYHGEQMPLYHMHDYLAPTAVRSDSDLRFLAERIEREHPEIAEEEWY
jgi:hypothetical protein